MKDELSEGEVNLAIRLFAGRQLCDREGFDEAQATAYVRQHEGELVEAMGDAVIRYLNDVPETDESDD